MTSIPQGEVSATKLSTAFGRAGCGMKFYYRYVEGIRGVTNASLLAGIAFDVATRKLHEDMIAGDEPTNITETFVEAWENPTETNRDGEPVEYDLSDAPADIIGRGTNALDQYAEQAKRMKPIAAQVFVKTSFEETDVNLVGYIDLVEATEKGLCISDVKTSISSRKKWSVEDAQRDAQLAIYAAIYDEPVGVVGWRHARLGGTVEVGSTHIIAPPKNIILTRLSAWISELERWCQTGLFPPTGLDKDAWVCSEKYCDYYHRCPYGATAQTINPVSL